MERIRKSIKYVILAGYPIVLFYVTAFMTYNPFERTRWKAQIINLVLFELLVVLLLAITGRAVIALRIEIILALIISVINYYVLSFRGTPIVPWDIFSLGTAASVAGSYRYTMSARQVLLIALMLLMVYTARFARIKIERARWKQRLTAGIPGMAAILGITVALWQESVVNKLELYPFLFTPTVMYERNGFAVTFLMDLQYMSVDKPDGYSEEYSKELLEKYKTTDSESTKKLANVIVVMDEAFSDPAVLGDFTTNEDYMPFYHALCEGEENTVTGQLAVSVKGGNTANTEFEFLTGNTMAFLPAGSIPYQQYIRGEIPSLASHLKSLGYQTYAMHPYYASGWNRDKVYPLLGFDTFYAKEDFTKASYIRGYVDDMSCVNKIIETYEQKEEGTPLFVFNVTMQNHSPYTDGYYDTSGNIAVDGTEPGQLSEYLTLMRRSDEALEELISYFSKVSEPTVIVFFGDHQPTDSVVEPILNQNGKTSATLSEEDNAMRYEVPYVIWANYDIEEKTGCDTGANFLAAQMMEYAGIPMSDYQNYLLSLQEEIPVISTQQTNDLNTERGKEYQALQYYLLFDYKKEKTP